MLRCLCLSLLLLRSAAGSCGLESVGVDDGYGVGRSESAISASVRPCFGNPGIDGTATTFAAKVCLLPTCKPEGL